jgi:hypothetical protein
MTKQSWLCCVPLLAAMASARAADPPATVKPGATAQPAASQPTAAQPTATKPPAAPEYPPKPAEVPAPAGVAIKNELPLITVRLADVVRGPVPKRLEGAVAWIRPYRTFKPTTDAGLITLEITTDGPVYLAATWVRDGTLEDAKKSQLKSDQDLTGGGWMAVSLVGIVHRSRNEAETHTVFVRYCRAGEKFTLRTRAYLPPIVIQVADDKLSPETIAALEPDVDLPEQLQRMFTGARALNLVAERRFDELERWAGGLLASGAVFPSGHYRIRSVGRAFQYSHASYGPEHFERHLPGWKAWLEAYPESNAGRLVVAAVLIEYSKTLRLRNSGTSRPADVDEARRRAMELLYEVEQSDAKLPHMYLEYMLLANEERWDEDLATEYYRRAVASGAWCPQAVGQFISYLNRVSDGSYSEAFRRKVQDHVESAVAATRSTHGEQMYAAAIKDIEFYHPNFPLRGLGFEWPRLRASFEEIVAAGPESRRTTLAYARLAAAAGDKPTAERLFKKLGSYREEDSESWSSEVEYNLNRIWASPNFTSGDQRLLFDLSADGGLGLAWTDKGPHYLDRKGRIYSLDPTTGAQTEVARGWESVYLCMASSLNGEITIWGSWFGRLSVYFAERDKALRYRLNGLPAITYAAASPDGRRAAFSRESGEVNLLDMTEESPEITKQRTFQMAEPKEWTRYMEFTPDGRRLITYAGTEVVVRDADTLERVTAWKTGADRGTAAALAPAGDVLATIDRQTVRFWSLADGKPLGTVNVTGTMVRAMRFSRDGRRLAVGSGEYEHLALSPVNVIDVAEFRLLKTFAGHKASVLGVAFSPDGRTLLSVSLDRSARLWDVP